MSTPATERTNLLGFPRPALETFVAQLGSRPFRARQLMNWIYKRGASEFAAMTDLAKDFRARLAARAEVRPPEIVGVQRSADGTVKWLLKADAAQAFEMVFIPEPDRGTLCISSQVGCALDCSFCSTAQQGFNRNLTTAEIVGQVWLAMSELAREDAAAGSPAAERRVTNVVLMGMGEPLANFRNVVPALDILLDYFGIRSAIPYERVLSGSVMPDVEWFPGAQVSYVEHLFRGRDPDRVAVIDARESAQPGAGPVSRHLTWGMLREQTGALAVMLRELGVGPGDRVAGYVPNAAEAVIAFLATASLGAIWSGCGQDYSPAAAAERLGQLEPVVLIAADGYRYGGRAFDRRGSVGELAALLPSLRATILFPRLGLPADALLAGTGAGRLGWPSPAGSAELAPQPVPFSHPLWVLFSSGTTGRPKGIVHSTGGVLLEHLKAMSLSLDLGEHDTFFWYTSPSWMVWNYLVSGLLAGARIVCYDGSPSYPSWQALWALAAEHRVTLLGTSPAHLRGCAQAGVEPARDNDLSALRSLGSSGSALPSDAYFWVSDHVGRQVRVNSTSGGTDVVSAFAGGSPIVPVWPGELSAPCLGVALDSWDSRGKAVRGGVGELVITKPMPSMPVAFWDDPGGSRYREAYFGTYPGVWRHGDWITITDRWSVVVHGRSDATLNRHGIRMGSSDIYHVVEQLDEIAEALVVGVEQPEGEYWMPLFVVLNPGHELDDALTAKIRRVIREGASPRHVPDEIIATPAIPHTRTGKKLEVPVKRILQGGDPGQVMDAGAVENPDALLWFAAYQTRTPIQ